MNSKTPKGVVIFSWLIIIGSIGSIATLAIEPARAMQPTYINVFYFVISLFSLVTAVYLLKLKKWARVAIVAISLAVGVETLVTMPQVFKQYEKQTSSKQLKESFIKGIETQLKTGDKTLAYMNPAWLKQNEENIIRFSRALTNVILVLFISPFFGFNVATIYYFTRPKVKEQFK